MHEHRHAVRQAALAAGWSHRHRDVSGGWLRPTVFGAVDGLVTNTSLIAGLGGGGVSAHTVIRTGVAAEEVELAETFAGYGADPQTAARMAAAVSSDPDTAFREWALRWPPRWASPRWRC